MACNLTKLENDIFVYFPLLDETVRTIHGPFEVLKRQWNLAACISRLPWNRWVRRFFTFANMLDPTELAVNMALEYALENEVFFTKTFLHRRSLSAC